MLEGRSAARAQPVSGGRPEARRRRSSSTTWEGKVVDGARSRRRWASTGFSRPATRLRELPCSIATRDPAPPRVRHTHGVGGGPGPRAQVHTPPPLARDERLLDVLTADMRRSATSARSAHQADLPRRRAACWTTSSPSSSRGRRRRQVRHRRAGPGCSPTDALVPLTGMCEHFLAYDDRRSGTGSSSCSRRAGMSGENADLPDQDVALGGRDPARHRRSQPGGLHAREVCARDRQG